MVYSNFKPVEGLLTGDTVISLDWRAIKLIITNQSATKTLKFKFSESGEYGTLNPTEEATISGLYQKKIYLRASSGEVNYRVWAFG